MAAAKTVQVKAHTRRKPTTKKKTSKKAKKAS